MQPQQEPTWRIRATGVSWRQVEGEVVALDMDRSRYLAFNRTGAVLWEALQRGASHRQLVEVLTDRFDTTSEQADEDVRRFLADLHTQGLLA